MVTLPIQFVALPIPGYFWNLDDKVVYSIKSGILKKLAPCVYYSSYYRQVRRGWKVSNNGRKVFFDKQDLVKLTPADSVIPVARL